MAYLLRGPKVMSLADQLQAQLKETHPPTPRKESSFPLPQPRNEEAYQKVTELIEEATNSGCGSVVITLSSVCDKYKLFSPPWFSSIFYSQRAVVNELKEESFEVEQQEDLIDAISFKVTWSDEHPTYHSNDSFFIRL